MGKKKKRKDVLHTRTAMCVITGFIVTFTYLLTLFAVSRIGTLLHTYGTEKTIITT